MDIAAILLAVLVEADFFNDLTVLNPLNIQMTADRAYCVCGVGGGGGGGGDNHTRNIHIESVQRNRRKWNNCSLTHN